jgi:hypothetical protein
MAKMCVVTLMAGSKCGREAVEGEQLCKSHLASVKTYGDRSWAVMSGAVKPTGKHSPDKVKAPAATYSALRQLGLLKMPVSAKGEAVIEGKAKKATKKQVSRKQKNLAAMIKSHAAEIVAAAAAIPVPVAEAPVAVALAVPEVKAVAND